MSRHWVNDGVASHGGAWSTRTLLAHVLPEMRVQRVPKKEFSALFRGGGFLFVWRAKGLRRGAISIHNSIREREQPRGCRRRAGALARWVLNALFAAWWAAEDQKWEPQKEKEGIGAEDYSIRNKEIR
jgi:hypothetical protein